MITQADLIHFAERPEALVSLIENGGKRPKAIVIGGNEEEIEHNEPVRALLRRVRALGIEVVWERPADWSGRRVQRYTL